MVEINNQRKAFLDMLAWSEWTDNGRQENQKSWLWRHCRRRAIYRLLRSPSQTCHAKPKLKSTGAGRYQLLSCWCGMPTASSFTWKTSLRKVRTLWYCSRLRSVALLPMIDRGDIRQAIDRCSNIWAYCRALVMVSSSIRLDSLIAKFKKRAERSERWCMSRVTAIISALVICIIVCPSWAVNHYRDNAITYKAQRQKCQRTEAGERGNYWHADASAWCCCARCKIHEGVSWC